MTVEKAIEILSDVGDINRCCEEDAEALDMAIKALEQQTTRPTARWERVMDYNKCSKCGKLTKFYLKYNYCPICGAKMQEVEG